MLSFSALLNNSQLFLDVDSIKNLMKILVLLVKNPYGIWKLQYWHLIVILITSPHAWIC